VTQDGDGQVPGRIRDEDIALVRERSAIDDVVGEYLQLRNAGGGSLKGLCPFHEEKTPSFNVTPARGLWYCFSCAEGGDVIKFVQRIDSLGFAEAVERLAARIGIELRYEQGGHVPGQEQTLRRRLIQAHRAAADFYAEQLGSPGAAAGRDFLTSRGFTRADAEHFGVGFAPEGWDAATRHLRGRGFTEQELLTGGLASNGRRGLIDKFRGRLIWPIADLTGDVIAFGARKLRTDDDGPKYLNTPETPLFKKSSVLYGADLARREISQRRQAVIVEGYTDVMACHLSGIGTAVATSGTSFGEGHVGILRRLLMDSDKFLGEVIFTFDGDAAGQKAALRAFSLEERFVTQTFVAVQPDGLDPCDLRIKHGDAAVRDLIAQRVPVFEFAIRSELARHNLETNEGRLAALDDAARIVGRIKDPGLRDRYAISLDRWLGMMDEGFVLKRVRQHSGPVPAGGRDRAQYRRGAANGTGGPGNGTGRPGVPQPRDGDAPPYDQRDPVTQIEREALKLAVQRPALCGPAFDALGAGCFTAAAVHSAAFAVITACGGAVSAAGGGREWAEQLRGAAPDDGVRAFITQLAVEPARAPRADGEPDARYASEVLARVEELAVSRQIAAIKSRLQRLNPVTEQGEYNKMFGDLVALEQRRKVLSGPAADAL
jgi:DNA primase